jgi:signal transduction histidine kinase
VTERTEAEARIRQLARQLEDASRMKDQFLSNLSHELRTPITAIRLWTDVLRNPDPGDMETIREAVGMIRHSAVTQSLLIEDLLDVTRIIGGRLTVDLRPMGLAEVVRHTVELLEPMARSGEVAVRAELPPACGVATGTSKGTAGRRRGDRTVPDGGRRPGGCSRSSGTC